MHRALVVSLLEILVAVFVMVVQWRALPRFEDSYVYVCGAAELVFYALLYFVTRGAWRWLRRDFPRTSAPLWLSATVHAAVAMGLVTLALAPWLFGYGWEDVDVPSALSRVSLGAMFAISPPLLLGDAIPITYHSFVQWVILWPTLCLFAAPGIFAWAYSVLGYPAVVWMASLSYYGAGGALVATFAPGAGSPFSFDGRAPWRPQRWVRPVALVAHIVVIPYLLATIPSVDPVRFTRSAVELQRAPRWRYGYVRRYHDTMLVKARRTGNDPAFVAPEPTDRAASLMLGELQSRPSKAALELVFYAILLWLWKVGRPRVTDALRAHPLVPQRGAGGRAGDHYLHDAVSPIWIWRSVDVHDSRSCCVLSACTHRGSDASAGGDPGCVR